MKLPKNLIHDVLLRIECFVCCLMDYSKLLLLLLSYGLEVRAEIIAWVFNGFPDATRLCLLGWVMSLFNYIVSWLKIN